jgi:hypothetical protein
MNRGLPLFPSSAWERHVSKLRFAYVLVPRLCLGTPCVRGAASRIALKIKQLYTRGTASKARRSQALPGNDLISLTREAEPRRQRVPRQSLAIRGAR